MWDTSTVPLKTVLQVQMVVALTGLPALTMVK